MSKNSYKSSTVESMLQQKESSIKNLEEKLTKTSEKLQEVTTKCQQLENENNSLRGLKDELREKNILIKKLKRNFEEKDKVNNSKLRNLSASPERRTPTTRRNPSGLLDSTNDSAVNSNINSPVRDAVPKMQFFSPLKDNKDEANPVQCAPEMGNSTSRSGLSRVNSGGNIVASARSSHRSARDAKEELDQSSVENSPEKSPRVTNLLSKSQSFRRDESKDNIDTFENENSDSSAINRKTLNESK